MSHMYKVVLKKANGAYDSAIAHGAALVKYGTGEGHYWLSAPPKFSQEGYHLVVFDTPENAKTWASKDHPTEFEGDLVIFECEVEEEMDSPERKLIGEIAQGSPASAGASSFTWPKGTRMVRRLRLLSEVAVISK